MACSGAMAGGAQGAVYPDEKTQEYLYSLCERTGMDYPLLLGIWVSESTASVNHGGAGGTMGLTYSPLLDIVDTGNNAGIPNNYREELEKVVRETHKEVYGTEYTGNFSRGDIKIDAVYSILELTVQSYHWEGGGSCNINNTYQAWQNYIASSSGGTGRSITYANEIRRELGWDTIDYKTMLQQGTGNFTRDLNW